MIPSPRPPLATPGPRTEGERAVLAPTADAVDQAPGLLAEVLGLVAWDVDGLAAERPRLRPVQLEALGELKRAGGLLGAIGVGHGKTLIALLAAAVLCSERPCYLCPPGLVEVALDEAVRWGRWFQVRGDLAILPYSLLSRPERADVLDDLRPDLLVADEAHHLRHRTSARTKRVLRYLYEHPDCAFVALSGTLTSRSILDLAHLAEAALGEGSPLPRHGRDLSAWAAVLDADGDPIPEDYGAVEPLVERFGYVGRARRFTRTDARHALRERLRRTPGVVLTEDASCDASLVLRRVREPSPPSEVLELIERVRREGATPDGERVFATDEEGSTCCRQLAMGFWYSWDWRGVDEATRRDWLDARSAYYSGLRYLLSCELPGLDSPALLEAAAGRALDERAAGDAWAHASPLPTWYLDRLERWREVEPTARPRQVVHWASRYLVEDAARWLRAQREPAILWYRDRAFGAALAELGLDVRGEGDQPPAVAGPVALSMAAQGQGHNLQAWRVSRIAGCPSSGKLLEQVLGRTHRQGQRADVVVCDVYLHHEGEVRALARALEDARYVEEATGGRQKLRLARVVDARGGVDDL